MKPHPTQNTCLADPIHIISLGAGVQSSTMALMAAHGEITPMPKCAIFADTQAEPKSVYTWLDWLEKQLPFPVHRVTAGSLEARELTLKRSGKSGLVYRKSGVPLFMLSRDGQIGIITRKCTADFKIVPITRFLRRFKASGVIQWFGISTDEAARMKDSKFAWISHRYPLIETMKSRHDCFRWMEQRGFPKPPRSACVFCPYHSDSEWRRLKFDEPLEFQRAAELERRIQEVSRGDTTTARTPFLHSSCKPLAGVDFSTEEERGQLNMFNNECEGMCGV